MPLSLSYCRRSLIQRVLSARARADGYTHLVVEHDRGLAQVVCDNPLHHGASRVFAGVPPTPIESSNRAVRWLIPARLISAGLCRRG